MLNEKIIYSDDKIEIKTTGHDYDFIAIVENKTNKDITIVFNDDSYDSFIVSANDWVGILADKEGCLLTKELKANNFTTIVNK